MSDSKDVIAAIKTLMTGEGHVAGFWLVSSKGLHAFEEGFAKLLRERLPKLADHNEEGGKSIALCFDDCCNQRSAVEAAVTALGGKVVDASKKRSELPEDMREALEAEARVCEDQASPRKEGDQRHRKSVALSNDGEDEERVASFKWDGPTVRARASEEARDQ